MDQQGFGPAHCDRGGRTFRFQESPAREALALESETARSRPLCLSTPSDDDGSSVRGRPLETYLKRLQPRKDCRGKATDAQLGVKPSSVDSQASLCQQLGCDFALMRYPGVKHEPAVRTSS